MVELEAQKTGQKIRVTVESRGGKFVFSIVGLFVIGCVFDILSYHRFITVNVKCDELMKISGIVSDSSPLPLMFLTNSKF